MVDRERWIVTTETRHAERVLVGGVLVGAVLAGSRGWGRGEAGGQAAGGGHANARPTPIFLQQNPPLYTLPPTHILASMLVVPHKGPTPLKATPGSSGYDLASTEDVEIPRWNMALISTGLHLEIPKRWEAQVRSRSGLAAKARLFVLNSPGTIDSDYRGEIKVLLFNASDSPYRVKVGDRIAQLVFAPVSEAIFTPVDEMSATERGMGGFGSTGVSSATTA